MSDDLDAILDALKGPNAAAGGGSAIDPITLMIMQMQNDRADRAASRQMMIQMVTALAPLVLPMIMGKKEADPVLMTLLTGLLSKNNDGEQLKSFMQMMSAASSMSMEQMKTSMLSIMELKDQQTKKLLEDHGERDDEPASGPAAIMREIRLGLGAVAGLVPQGGSQPAATQPALPAPAAAPAAGSNPPPAQAQRPPPIVVVLHQLQAIQSGKVKETPAAWSALSCVALQDDALLVALDDCTDDDLQPLFAYCLPHLKASAPLMAWVQADGVAQWIDKKVRAKLLPLIDAARDDGSDDANDDSNEQPTDGMHPMPGADNEPEELQPPEAAEG